MMEDNFLLLLIFLRLTLGFNVDTDFPIIFQDLTEDRSSSSTHFGASLTLLPSGWLMIGAPKANSQAANYTDIKEPGVLWRCQVGPGPKECRQVNMDPTGNLDVRVERVPFELVHRDRKDDGMLGASMAAGDSERFVACGSRWVNQKYAGHHLMNGICYWVSKASLLSSTPNATWPWMSKGPSGLSYRLAPLLNRSRQAYTVPTIPVMDPPERRFDWAFGQTGFSIHISSNNELILGAPGILEWTGSVIRMKDIGRQPFVNVIVARAQHLSAANILHYFDYFGYSVTAGRFFQRVGKDIQYASGAPRAAGLCGKVLVFTFKEKEERESLNLLVEPLQGGNAHFGSYFGSALGALDTNGDGLDELLVGAPLYKSTLVNLRSIPQAHNINGEGSGSGDEGCVFIYISDGEGFRPTPQEICGDNQSGARFGSAIQRVGDLNTDGFQDVAIGAPYENEGRGAVYIYHGSRSGLVLAQKLDAEKIQDSLRGFGYAISPALDIDNNSYPDLAIGSASSNHVVVFRTIPVVNITGNLSASVSKLKTGTGVFEITSCLAFNGLNVPDTLQLILKLVLDTEVRKHRIAEFIPSPLQTSNHVVLKTGEYERTGTCHSFQATTIGDLDLVTLPLSVRQEFGLLVQPEESIQGRSLSYVIQEKATGELGEAELVQTGDPDAVYEDFNKKWPLPMSTVFGSTKLSLPLAAICEEDGDPVCLATLKLTPLLRTPDGDIYTGEGGAEFLIGSYRSISLEVIVLNERETANLPLTLTIRWRSPPTFRSSRSDCTRLNPELGGDEVILICTLRKPLTRNKSEVVEVELEMWGVFGDRNFLEFELTANTSSALTQIPHILFKPPLATKSEVLIFGQLSDAPYYENITVETINFTHTFEVGMNGASPIASLQMEFLIPRDVSVGGEMMELLRIREPVSTYDGSTLRCKAINGNFYVDNTPRTSVLEDLELETLDEGRRRGKEAGLGRVRRSANPIPRLRTKPAHLSINCTMQGIFCLKVQCEANRFRPTSRAVLEFRLRVLTKTAGLLFAEVDEREVIVIQSEGSVIASNAEGDRYGKSAQSVSKTILKVEPPQEIGAWIVIVSFAGGLVLLTLIALLLSKCGFFRRRKKEELYALRTEQEMCDTFGYPPQPQFQDYANVMDPNLPNYDYEEISDFDEQNSD